jgi:hypothetical protein
LMRHAGGMSSGYAEARDHVLPASLSELAGPTSGVVSLPVRLHWGPDNSYDLGDDGETAVMYERVVREAHHREDLGAYLEAGRLRTLWPRLVLPPVVRRLWESRFPELRESRSVAA